MERHELEALFRNSLLKVRVIPNSSTDQIAGFDSDKGELKIRVKAPPEKGRANKELIKFFKKRYSMDIKIVKGLSSRSKIIKK